VKCGRTPANVGSARAPDNFLCFSCVVINGTVISKEQPVSGGGGVSGSRFNVRD